MNQCFFNSHFEPKQSANLFLHKLFCFKQKRFIYFSDTRKGKVHWNDKGVPFVKEASKSFNTVIKKKKKEKAN